MITKRTFLQTMAAGSCLLGGLGRAHAQPYPAMTVKIVIAGGPGGPNEFVGRLAAEIISKLGHPAIVEHRPGAGGALGARAVAGAVPDGHTLLVGNTATLAVIPAVSASAGYDPVKSFVPIARFWESYQVIVVTPSLPVSTLGEFVALAKASADKLNYSHGTSGGLPHLAGELFAARAGVRMVGVPYRSEPEFITAVMSGSVQMAIPSIETALPLIRDGKLRALGVTSEVRTPLAPDLPTVIEGGIPDYEVTTFFGLVAPAGTPEAIIRRLNSALNEGLLSVDTQATIARLGAVSRPGSPEEFAAFIADKRLKWANIAKTVGMNVD